MIRDPSDGSVKEMCSLCGKPADWDGTFNCCRPEVPTKARIAKTYSSGLPITKAKAEYLERLEESRKWLKDFIQKNSSG